MKWLCWIYCTYYINHQFNIFNFLHIAFFTFSMFGAYCKIGESTKIFKHQLVGIYSINSLNFLYMVFLTMPYLTLVMFQKWKTDQTSPHRKGRKFKILKFWIFFFLFRFLSVFTNHLSQAMCMPNLVEVHLTACAKNWTFLNFNLFPEFSTNQNNFAFG